MFRLPHEAPYARSNYLQLVISMIMSSVDILGFVKYTIMTGCARLLAVSLSSLPGPALKWEVG